MPVDVTDIATIESLQNMTVIEARAAEDKSGKGGIRIDALKEAAFGLGARGGLDAQTRKINDVLETNARRLDTIFDFSPLIIQGRVVPPVLTEMRDVYTQPDTKTIRLSGRAYKIERQALFASRPPNWRDYLVQSYSTKAMPSPALLPRSEDERAIWKKAVQDGWTSGVEQASAIFTVNLNMLMRDYVGMTRYHILATKGMVTMPLVAVQSMPLNGSAEEMTLDESLLRITVTPSFVRDPQAWSADGSEEGLLTGDAR